MTIAIIGTGMVGRALSAKLNELGHNVTLGTKNVADTLAKTEPDAYENPPFKEWISEYQGIKLKTFANAVKDAEIIFNCTPGAFSLKILNEAGKNNISDKIIVDVSNGFNFSTGTLSLTPVNTDSLAEQIQREFPKAKVVKTLNNVNNTLMVNPQKLGNKHNVFISGNNEESKKTVKNILQQFDWESQQIIDLGGIENARGQEMMLLLWWRLYELNGNGDFNFYINK